MLQQQLTMRRLHVPTRGYSPHRNNARYAVGRRAKDYYAVNDGLKRALPTALARQDPSTAPPHLNSPHVAASRPPPGALAAVPPARLH